MKQRVHFLLASLLIVGMAFALRWHGHDWDQGHLLHPDERFLCMVTEKLRQPASLAEWFDTRVSPFNPYNQDFPTYVYGAFPLWVVHRFIDTDPSPGLSAIAKTGRLISTLWDCASVLLLMLLARRVGSRRLALWSGAALALAVFPIQQAHFYTVDSAAAFFALLTVSLGLVAAKEGRSWLLLPAGLALGLALASRINLVLLFPWLGAAALAIAWRKRQPAALAYYVGAVLLAVAVFRVAQPFAFLGWGFNPQWLADMRQVIAISSSELEVPFTLQWVGRMPYGFALYNLVAWGLGWPLGLAAVGGGGFLLWRSRLTPGHWTFLLALWPLMLIGYHGRIFQHTLRYFLPAYAPLLLLAALALAHLRPRALQNLLAGLILAATAAYALAFQQIYRVPHPRVQASEWIYQSLPDGGKITCEHWDDALPLWMPEHADAHAKLRFLEMPVYDPDSPVKLERMLRAIDQADLIVLSSTRASDSIPRMPQRYPVTSHYFQRLTQGRLGLEEVARFQSRPHLLGWAWDSLRAEEAFQVYDHPLVRVYRKTTVWDLEVVRELLSEGVDFDTLPDIRYRHAGRWNQGWFTPEAWQARQRERTPADLFPPDGAGNRQPLVTWIIAMVLLGVAAFPLCFRWFRHLPDQGWLLSRLVGLLLVSAGAWWPASLGWLAFGPALNVAGLALFATSCALFAVDYEKHLRWFRHRGGKALSGEIVFWSVFAFFLVLRSRIPDLWHPWSGGEKPMDFAFLNATALSAYFPPPNPWLAGAFLNYYYYGFVLVATLVRMTGISPALAYNLALPTFAAFTAGAVFSLAGALLPLLRAGPGWRGWRRSGGLAVALTLFLGNLGQARWLLEGSPGHIHQGYWNASRVIRVPQGVVEPITEFPFFTLLYGDLHAHLMALPLAILALLASWQLLRAFHPLRVVGCAFVLGTLWVTNAWDFPVQAAIFCAVLLSAALRVPLAAMPAVLWRRGGWMVLGLALARAFYAPFHRHYLAPAGGFIPWEGPRSSLLDLLLAQGLFLIPLACALPMLRGHLRRAPGFHRVGLALVGLGCLFLILLVEFVTLEADIGRMNMVFKFYYQVWWMLALLTAPVVVAATARFRAGMREAWPLGIIAVVFACGALYPLTAPRARLRDRFWDTNVQGLDGLAYMRDAVWTYEGVPLPLDGDLRAIRWLRRNARPYDVLMEAQRPEYQWGGRMSWHTGLPALVGWNWHMRQQRPWHGGEREVIHRVRQVERFYTSTDPMEALSIAHRNGVRFVVAGRLEAMTYGEDCLDKFQGHPAFHLAFQDMDTRIYEITDCDLAAALPGQRKKP